MNGTSAAAPHVAGLIALMFEYAQKYAPGFPRDLTAEEIGDAIKIASNASSLASLRENRHQIVDAWVKKKQKDVLGDLTAYGRVDFKGAMNQLFP